MELDFEGRTALVTGASQGIGRTTARMLALAGVTVVGVARRVALIERLAGEVNGHGGGRIIPLAADSTTKMRRSVWLLKLGVCSDTSIF